MLDVLLDFFEDLAGKDDYACSAVTDFSILRSGNVDEDLGGGVNNVEQLGKSRKRQTSRSRMM